MIKFIFFVDYYRDTACEPTNVKMAEKMLYYKHQLKSKSFTATSKLTLYSIITPLKYHIFENIMENGAFIHNIFKSIQNVT